jgi:hypothetical protein
MTAVSVLSVSPRQVRAMFRHFSGGNASILPLKMDSLAPSEGRGQRFESSWVRHHFRQICPCYRQCHPVLFRVRSAQGICSRRAETRSRLGAIASVARSEGCALKMV